MPARRTTTKPAPSAAPATAASGTPDQVFIVTGSDEIAVKARARELAAELAPAEGGDLSVETLDGMAESADQAAAVIREAVLSLSMQGFFGASKLVWLKNATFLEDSVTGRSKAVAEALEELHAVLTAGLPSGTLFLLSAPGADKRKAFYKSLPRLGSVTVLDKPSAGRFGDDEETALELATRAARAQSLRFQATALERFASYVGSDHRQVLNEIEKLAVFLGPDRPEITEDDVRLLVPETRRGVIFDLSNCLGRRDLPAAMASLGKLLGQGEDPVGILYAAILPTLRNLLAAGLLVHQHGLRVPDNLGAFTAALSRLPDAWQDILPRKKDGTVNAYGLMIACRQARNFTLGELIAAMNACAETNLQILSTGTDPELVLQQFLVRILTRPARRQRAA